MPSRRDYATELDPVSRLIVLANRAAAWIVALAIAVALLALLTGRAHAQASVKTNLAKVTVLSIGHVVSHTGVVAGDRDKGGNLFASTTVVTTNNGPYALQAKLTVPFTDKNKSTIVNTVEAISPPGTAYVALSTTTWVTVAIGTGGPNKNNTIQLYVDWGKSSSKDPNQIPNIQLTYQVIPTSCAIRCRHPANRSPSLDLTLDRQGCPPPPLQSKIVLASVSGVSAPARSPRPNFSPS